MNNFDFFASNNWNNQLHMVLSQISIYGVACSICFANLNIHVQEAKSKNNGIKIIDKQGVII